MYDLVTQYGMKEEQLRNLFELKIMFDKINWKLRKLVEKLKISQLNHKYISI